MALGLIEREKKKQFVDEVEPRVRSVAEGGGVSDVQHGGGGFGLGRAPPSVPEVHQPSPPLDEESAPSLGASALEMINASAPASIAALILRFHRRKRNSHFASIPNCTHDL